MKFIETPLRGLFVLDLERLEDPRGFFARCWCEREFERHGLDTSLKQCNVSFNHHRGTLRGLHFQCPPHGEAKLVRCTRGAIWDVVVDLRRSSPNYLQHFAIELNEDNRSMLYIPEGFAHGFLTLRDATEVFYQMSTFFAPDAAAGYRWNDPAFSISWPVAGDLVISEKDQALPLYDAATTIFS
jgi:dTDP-4-dehydrorhamnose 3,5-epimerase